jgi:hypothetical protein
MARQAPPHLQKKTAACADIVQSLLTDTLFFTEKLTLRELKPHAIILGRDVNANIYEHNAYVNRVEKIRTALLAITAAEWKEIDDKIASMEIACQIKPHEPLGPASIVMTLGQLKKYNLQAFSLWAHLSNAQVHTELLEDLVFVAADGDTTYKSRHLETWRV